jgi:putative transposase
MEFPDRKRIRIPQYDYSQNGAYFVTVCTYERRKILAETGRGGALLRPIGKSAEEELLKLPERYKYVSIDKFVVMPNHIHAIISIDRPVRAEQSPAPTISEIICTFKSITAKTANKMDGTPGRQIWQRSFNDHVIRCDEEYTEIWRYIDDNPRKWEEDGLFVP